MNGPGPFSQSMCPHSTYLGTQGLDARARRWRPPNLLTACLGAAVPALEADATLESI